MFHSLPAAVISASWHFFSLRATTGGCMYKAGGVTLGSLHLVLDEIYSIQ